MLTIFPSEDALKSKHPLGPPICFHCREDTAYQLAVSFREQADCEGASWVQGLRARQALLRLKDD